MDTGNFLEDPYEKLAQIALQAVLCKPRHIMEEASGIPLI